MLALPCRLPPKLALWPPMLDLPWPILALCETLATLGRDAATGFGVDAEPMTLLPVESGAALDALRLALAIDAAVPDIKLSLSRRFFSCKADLSLRGSMTRELSESVEPPEAERGEVERRRGMAEPCDNREDDLRIATSGWFSSTCWMEVIVGGGGIFWFPSWLPLFIVFVTVEGAVLGALAEYETGEE